MNTYKIITGDCIDGLRTLPDASVHCCVTSPPYWGLRDYGHDGQIGLESTPEAYVARMVEVFREVRRVLRHDGTLWLNLGDSYVGTGAKGEYKDPKHPEGRNAQSGTPKNNKVAGLRSKDLCGIPWRVAFALQADGWWLRQDIIWHKPNPMPESVRDRCTKAHEYVFLLTKSAKYYYDADAVKEPASNWGTRDRSEMRKGTIDPKLKHHGLEGKDWEDNPMKNKRSVWTVNTKGYNCAHFAVMPSALVEPCIKAGCPEGGVVLDPFTGSGTTGAVAIGLGRNFVGTELNPEYVKLAEERIRKTFPMFHSQQ